MSEADEQREIVAWFRAEYPEYAHCLRVSQSGVIRYGRRGIIQRNHMRAQGVVDGESDIAILLPRAGFGSLLIEHKAAQGTHKTTDAQLAYIQKHNSTGNCAIVTRGVDLCKAAIRQYMAGDVAP